jgi:beta-lactamase class D
MRILQALIIAALLCSHAHAEDKTLADLFSAVGVEGTIVLSKLDAGLEFVHDDQRAARPLPVASTFKIFNSLIALDEGVIAGTDAILTWDGRIHDFPDWNRDQTLASAYKVSCVWCYQELARRIGPQKYRAHLRAADYGQLREPFDPVAFWLDGSLQISAREQVAFLRKIIRRSLPYKASSYDALRDLMVVEKNGGYTLRAKTGWATRPTPQIGWYVGYVETPEDIWIFATNIDIRDSNDLPLRQALTLQCLKAKGIIALGRPAG